MTKSTFFQSRRLQKIRHFLPIQLLFLLDFLCTEIYICLLAFPRAYRCSCRSVVRSLIHVSGSMHPQNACSAGRSRICALWKHNFPNSSCQVHCGWIISQISASLVPLRPFSLTCHPSFPYPSLPNCIQLKEKKLCLSVWALTSQELGFPPAILPLWNRSHLFDIDLLAQITAKDPPPISPSAWHLFVTRAWC